MSHFKSFLVDCTLNEDTINSSSGEHFFKNLDVALETIKSGNKIKIYPGNYPGSNITSINGPFQYELEGTGLEVEMGLIGHEGFIDCKFKDMRMRDVDLNCFSSNLDFQRITFIGGHKLKCKGYLCSNENPSNEIEFVDCTFGINFQITVESGIYCFTFKNCKFKSKIMPIIYVKDGDVEIKATMCNFNTPIVVNKRGCVYIHHTSCNFTTELWNGKECSVFTKDDEVAFSALKSYKIENYDQYENNEQYIKQNQQLQHHHKQHKNDDIGLFSRALEINTNQFSHVKLKENTEFLRVYGSSNITIDLPDVKNLNNGHKIEIINEVPFVTINDTEYYSRMINIRYITQNGWRFY